jgi:3-phenylpropionate/trans-cinnamate dioxygenase ferredoxin reductase subunit
VTGLRAVIVGASHAGAQLAASLRQGGWTDEIVLIGDEATLPYQRPPMSKAYLAGHSALDQLAIRSKDFYTKQDIRLLDASVESIDRSARLLRLGAGETLTYDKLALCTGARVRRLGLPGADLPGVHYLRTVSDAEGIRTAAVQGRRAVVIGGGYVGLEVAASLRTLGLEVVVLEACGRVLERVTAPEVSAFYERIHRAEGVDVRTGAAVAAIAGETHVREVRLDDGEVIPADLVVVGVGVEPNTELAVAAGLTVDNGVVIDRHARTSDPDILAAGDCASHDMARYGRRIRLESVPSATEQAKVAAATMCGTPKEISALPWFWSDQYDLKLQIAGVNTGYDEVILNGAPVHDRDFTCYYLRQGELIAADCINRPRDFVTSKRVIAQNLPVEREQLARVAESTHGSTTPAPVVP